MTDLPLSRRLEGWSARYLLNLPDALLRILAGRPVVSEGQTLDVQTQLLLRLLRLRGESALGASTPAAQRELMDRQCQVLAPHAHAGVHTRELRVAGADGDLGARLYRPEGAASGGGALVFFHGGGFVIGSLDSHDGVCRVLAERAGCAVIAVDYRLAPEHPAPAAVEDALAAFRDIAARAGEFGLDAGRLAVGGDSAGGNLAAVVAQRARADAAPPCFQLLCYPSVDYARDRPSVVTYGEGFVLEKASMDWFRGHYIPEGIALDDPIVSPIYGDLAGVAPAYIVTPGFDPLRDEGEAYGQALDAAGVAVRIERKPGMIHGFVNLAGAIHGADAALTEAGQALAQHLRPG